MSLTLLTVPTGGDDYWSAAVVWHNMMLTVRPCDALSSFARPGSSERSPSAGPRPTRVRRIYRWEKTTAVAVKIKLKRLGKIREPYYRIVIADSRTKRDGRAIEEIGKYHPKAEPSLIEVNSERVQHWLSVGAQPTDPVRVLLKVTGDWQKFTGEPGSEGTLRTAAPRGDKKEAFEAAAKASQASKDKDEKASAKGGPRARSAAGGKARAASAKTETAPAEEVPAASAKAETAPAEEVPAASAKAETAPAASAKAETAPAASAKAETAPAASAKAETAPAASAKAETAPAASAKAETAPAEESPAASAKAEDAPAASAKAEDAPAASPEEGASAAAEAPAEAAADAGTEA
jgi:small subunit ribosomal protein S16